MSCLPGTPCYTVGIGVTPPVPGGCNLDPCLDIKLGTKSVIYNGPSLPCSGINTCDDLTLALEKLDNLICNPPQLAITADNGLTKTGSNIQLGGNLIKPTEITTNFGYTLAIKGLMDEPLPDYFVTQYTDGVLTKTTPSAVASSVLATLSANNGITKTGSLIQLGGSLVIPTAITATPTNTLSIIGLQTDNNPDFVVTETTAGVVRRIPTSTLTGIISNPFTANNGLTKTGNNVQLGGALVQPTVITTSSTNTIALAGLSTSTSPNFILSETSGVVTKTSFSSLLPITADNGLTKTGNNIQLGGPLLTNTTIDLQTYSLILSENNGTIYSTNTFNSSASILQTGDDPIATPTGSFTRTITFKSSAATWLTNYASSAYNAQANWEAAHPWVTMNAAHNFQIVDHTHSVNKSSAFIGRYYDERVGNSNWNDTWISSGSPGFPGWISGNVYTLRTLKSGDVFPVGMSSSTISGTPGTSGWVFTSNGTSPTTWSNGSVIDGDFPKIDFADISAMVITKDVSGYGQVNTRANSLSGEHNYMSLGSNAIPTQKWGMAIGLNNNVSGGGYYGFAAGVANTIYGSSSYAIGETNSVSTGGSGALGISVDNKGYHSHGVGYDIKIGTANIGSFQCGSFNNVNAIDYTEEFGKTTYPVFSVGNGTQVGSNPAERLNAFHVMKSGFMKSRDGHDARAGQRGILPPQWSDVGWDDVGGKTFDAGAKYIIVQYESGDDFSNLVDRELWGEVNTSGYTFIANSSVNPANWLNGSEVVKVGRPSPGELGEMGFNLDANKMEYWDGSTWVQF